MHVLYYFVCGVQRMRVRANTDAVPRRVFTGVAYVLVKGEEDYCFDSLS